MFVLNRHVKLIFVATSLFLSGLACARGDVVVPVESTVEEETATPIQITQTPSPLPTERATPIPPSATPTLAGPEPISSPTLPPTPTLSLTGRRENVLYVTQPGDTLRNLAIRFGVIPADIRSTTSVLS